MHIKSFVDEMACVPGAFGRKSAERLRTKVQETITPKLSDANVFL